MNTQKLNSTFGLLCSKWAILVLLASFAFPSLLYGQGGALVSGITVLGSTGRPVAGATVTICSSTGAGVPCTPLASIFSDPGLTIPMANPTTTDGNGNVFVYATPGSYKYTVTGGAVSSTGQPFTATVAGSGGGNVLSGSPNTFTATNTFNGNVIETAGNNQIAACVYNNVLYVGQSGCFAGSDIGAQINAAYAALPSSIGGKIVITPQSSGTCYSYTTPIVMTTSSKYVVLEGFSGDSQAAGGTPSNGACLNYTPTTATAAITMDYVPAAGGGTTRNHGIRNLRLVNNNCSTIGGCGSSATGVSCTTVNAGCQNASWQNFGVIGFGTGVKFSIPASNSQASWGVNFSHGALSYNTTGLNIPTGIELTMLDDMKILGNATGVTMGGSSDFFMNGGSCDSNTTICVVSSGGSLSFDGVHFEGLGQNNMQMVNAGLAAHIHGGFALDDCVSAGACGGVTPAYWFQAQSLDVVGQDIFTAGRIPTLVYKYSSEAHVIGIKNIANVFPQDNIITMINGNAVFNQMNGNYAAIQASLFLADSGAVFSCSNVGSLTGWGSTATCTSPQGSNQRFQFTITANGAGITANPTLLVTLANPWPKPPLYLCKMVGGSAPVANLTGEQLSISTTTIGPIGYIQTPGAGQTVIISCLGI